jgi:hypothetical protein
MLLQIFVFLVTLLVVSYYHGVELSPSSKVRVNRYKPPDKKGVPHTRQRAAILISHDQTLLGIIH